MHNEDKTVYNIDRKKLKDIIILALEPSFIYDMPACVYKSRRPQRISPYVYFNLSTATGNRYYKNNKESSNTQRNHEIKGTPIFTFREEKERFCFLIQNELTSSFLRMVPSATHALSDGF